MSAGGAGEGGLAQSLRRMAGTLLEIGQARFELLTTEFELEKLRLFDALLWLAFGLLLVGVGLVLAVLWLLLALQEAHRAVALALAVLLTLGAGWFLIRKARQRLQGDAAPFAATSAELERDRAMLGPRE